MEPTKARYVNNIKYLSSLLYGYLKSVYLPTMYLMPQIRYLGNKIIRDIVKKINETAETCIPHISCDINKVLQKQGRNNTISQ